jgi:hypothetical protein
MTPDQMLQRADLVFVGVIERQDLESWPAIRFTVPDAGFSESKYWQVLRRRVRIELILRGNESRSMIDVYEVFWVGGASGDWNSTQNGERDVFLVRKENGRYHVVRDWWRSIYPVTSGPHDRLPLDDSHSLWERIALMNFWVLPNDDSARISYPHFTRMDPGGVLSLWRKVKLERGLIRHPSQSVRVLACRELLWLSGWGQDECWESLPDSDRALLATEIASNRLKGRARGASWWWDTYSDLESRRLLTAISDADLRAEFCRRWQREYLDDRDNGCPSDQPPPATIVTEKGEVPLVGSWPRQ